MFLVFSRDQGVGLWKCQSPCGGQGTGLVSTLPLVLPGCHQCNHSSSAFFSSIVDTHGPHLSAAHEIQQPSPPLPSYFWQSTPLSIVLQSLRAHESPYTLQLFMLESRKRSCTLQEELSRDFSYVEHEWLPESLGQRLNT